MKTFTVKITLQPDSGCVTGMVEIPGTFCRFLITSHADGSLCLWDLKRQKLHRVRVACTRFFVQGILPREGRVLGHLLFLRMHYGGRLHPWSMLH